MKECHPYLELKKELKFAFGLKKLEADTFKEISIAVFLKHKNYLSERSIKTFFAFESTKDIPSPFLLNSLV